LIQGIERARHCLLLGGRARSARRGLTALLWFARLSRALLGLASLLRLSALLRLACLRLTLRRLPGLRGLTLRRLRVWLLRISLRCILQSGEFLREFPRSPLNGRLRLRQLLGLRECLLCPGNVALRSLRDFAAELLDLLASLIAEPHLVPACALDVSGRLTGVLCNTWLLLRCIGELRILLCGRHRLLRGLLSKRLRLLRGLRGCLCLCLRFSGLFGRLLILALVFTALLRGLL
jgi:hypothetical protein